jgi:hypothetical protein
MHTTRPPSDRALLIMQFEGLQGPLGAEMWDQGDAVGAWSGAQLGAVLFPTADILDKVRCNQGVGELSNLSFRSHFVKSHF